MDNFIWLVFSHFMGDFALQSDWIAKTKGERWFVMVAHCMIWTACISIALQFLGIFALWKVLFLLLGHWGMDKWKTTKPKTPEAWKYIYPDQAWHLIQCLIVYLA